MLGKPKPRGHILKMRVPLTLFPPAMARGASHVFYGISSRLAPHMQFLEKWLYLTESDLPAKEYLNITILNAATYFVLVLALAYPVATKAGLPNPLTSAFIAAAVASLLVGFTCIVYPRWMNNKKVAQIDRDLLFAARHLRVQTTAGVPLFEALVSASHGYGSVSEELDKIVTSVQAGTNLADALEDSAVRNPSYYYSRILWQMANAVKAGTDIGPVLSDIVEFLSEEQRIEMRSYGAQLNTLAMMYLMVCIIVPTISLIFLMVISSFVDFAITDNIFVFILAGLVFVQYMFIGIIESRRPAVSL
jgi:pilus assembly protein TadC